jgi:flagellar protein FliS
MSYGSFSQNAARYREMEVSSATPGQLVVILYDHLLTHLAKAGLAMQKDQIGPRSDALQVCRTVLTELLVTLDRDRGGNVAVHLGSIYSFLLGELTTLGLRPDPARLERITGIVRELREAFAEIALTAPKAAPDARSVA